MFKRNVGGALLHSNSWTKDVDLGLGKDGL